MQFFIDDAARLLSVHCARQIVLQKLEWKGQPKVGSLANAKHRPGGGNVQVETQRLEFRRQASSKVGSRDNIHHRPGGGDVKVGRRRSSRSQSLPDDWDSLVTSLSCCQTGPSSSLARDSAGYSVAFKRRVQPRDNPRVELAGFSVQYTLHFSVLKGKCQYANMFDR